MSWVVLQQQALLGDLCISLCRKLGLFYLRSGSVFKQLLKLIVVTYNDAQIQQMCVRVCVYVCMHTLMCMSCVYVLNGNGDDKAPLFVTKMI